MRWVVFRVILVYVKQSILFSKSSKVFPKDETAESARLLLKAGFIHKAMAGVYEYLPLGYRVLRKIEAVIRNEMEAIGGQELLLSALQDKNIWNKSGRFDDRVLDVWFKTQLKNGSEVGLAPTHEEPLTFLMSKYIASYRDLPILAYQFQTKFRNELRAKSGILRTREFLMKDLYSFAKSEEEHGQIYEKVKATYFRIFEKLGLGDRTYLTFASGGSFSKYSHEFQTLSEAGEDTIYFSLKKKLAINKEVFNKETLKDLGLKENELEEVKAIEVGNIFSLGTKFSEAFGLNYKDENGKPQFVIMGSYGIGPGRVMGTLVEVLRDQNGMVWPEAIAPFRVHLLELEEAKGDLIYQSLQQFGIEVLYDDRKLQAGEKMAEADLIGIPYRVIVSRKTGDKIEVKKRNEKQSQLMTISEFIKNI